MPTRPSGDWTFERQALAEVDLPDRGLELGERGDRLLADGEDPHPGRRPAWKAGLPVTTWSISIDAAVRRARRGGAGRGIRATPALPGQGAVRRSSRGRDCGFPSR